MPTTRPFDRRLLGGLSPAAFLSRHWQKKPLLVRGAVIPPPALPGRAALAALAARDDIEARLVSSIGGRWSMTSGPIERLPRGARDWTLLVQGVNLVDAEADALMRRFDFVSAMRLDDCMISYAVDGGGVGPHLDSYDVFLVQVEGTRRWRWRDRPASSPRDRALVDGAPLKRLAHFEPTDEAILAPGDLLYLPPSCAHEGTAVGPCTTASIGFRAPSFDELAREFLFAMADRDGPPGRVEDRGRRPTTAPAALDAAMLAPIVDRLSRLSFGRRDIEDFVGRHFSEPKPHVYFDPPPPRSARRFAARAARTGVALDRRTTMLYRGGRGWIAGEAVALPAATRTAFRTLADRRVVDPATTAGLVADGASCELLHAWWSAGWLRFATEVQDGSS